MAKSWWRKYIPESSKSEKCGERGCRTREHQYSWQNSRRVPDWEMRIGTKVSFQKWALNVGTSWMSHPKTLPPPRMKGYNGGLLSKATELSLETIKTAGEVATATINLSSRGPQSPRWPLPLSPERRLQSESLRQAQASPFLSIAFFLRSANESELLVGHLTKPAECKRERGRPR